MKFGSKSIATFILLLVFGLFAGSLFWEIVERIIHMSGFTQFTLTMAEPLKIVDIYVVSLSLRANPGTILGMIGSIVLFIAL